MNAQTVDYKNFKVSPRVAPIIKYMEPVELNREKLHDLSKNWDSLSLLSQLGDAGVNMDEIKNNFTTLSSELINHLANEQLNKRIGEMTSKAQVAVDTVIRNLFERTADIGFLATDEDIRELLRKHNSQYSDGFGGHRDAIKRRFEEYIGKYSVYYEIVLMNTKGDVLANLDESNRISKSHDSVIEKVLTTSEEYVETFKKHDFLPQYDDTLVYSYKVTESSQSDAEVLGVLCLCFKFEDEMRGIFGNLVDPDTKECLTLLNPKGEVIASSDRYHIPLGATLEIVTDEYKIVSFGGRDYLAKSCETNGYQGFYGLGWYGHIMTPLDHAFNASNTGFQMSRELLLAILQHGGQFSSALKNIPIQAGNIQNNLNRAIWNGNVKQSGPHNHNKQFSRALLQEIRKTGENTKNIIGSSIASLTKTMVLGDSGFLAELIVDIMDRNLYERANDCRWWALTSDFRTIMDQNSINAFEREKMNSILSYINDLYTVYTNLFIYDTHGVVVAVSKPSESHLIGRKLPYEWVSKTLEITDSSKYYVSAFEPTNLYDGKHTYIYNASIRSLEDEGRVVGGIGVVFDSELQFGNMINELLPTRPDGSAKEGVFAVLATEERTIIASNDPEHVTGARLEVPEKFFDLAPGQSLSEIVEYRGNYYALGVTCSKGYREYKCAQDDYVNNVYSFFFSYISDVSETKVAVDTDGALERDISVEVDAQSVDIASFMVGSQWLGIDSAEVVEALSIDELRSMIRMEQDHHFKGTVIYNDHVISVIDIQNFIQEDVDKPYKEIVIIKFGSDDRFIGIMVHSLGDIPSVSPDRIRPLEEYIVGSGTLVKSVVFPPKDSNKKEVLTILSIEKINRQLVEPEQTHMIPRRIPA